MPESTDIKPNPDPSVLTTDALRREIEHIEDLINSRIQILEARLGGIDKATEVFQETLTRVPTETQREISHLKELVAQQFSGVQIQFAERDDRTKSDAASNDVKVSAAFAAQKEAAATQDNNNLRAIAKSEDNFIESLKTLNNLFRTSFDGQTQIITDLKDRLTTAEATSRQILASRTETRLDTGALVGILGAVIAVAAIIVGIILGVR